MNCEYFPKKENTSTIDLCAGEEVLSLGGRKLIFILYGFRALMSRDI